METVDQGLCRKIFLVIDFLWSQTITQLNSFTHFSKNDGYLILQLLDHCIGK